MARTSDHTGSTQTRSTASEPSLMQHPDSAAQQRSDASDAADGDTAILVPRRRPAQQRSREKFARMLEAARSVLVDHGFESFTFDEVAKRAEVPIGTLYQFFANKYVMICELDRQDTAVIVAELKKWPSRDPSIQWPDFLDNFIDHLAQLWKADPSRRAVWHAIQSTPATRATGAATESELLDLLAEVLIPLAPTLPLPERRKHAGILVHTATSLLNFAVRDATASPETYLTTVEEIKRMLIAYLFSVAQG